MIELYVLRQFVTFADAGTLSKAADVLHLSQPALSRNMKKLESDLEITLFERKQNRLELNKNGEYVLELARKLLEDTDSFIIKAREFDRRNRTISLGVCAPAPMWMLTPLITNRYPHMSLQTEIAEKDQLLSGLSDDTYQLIVLLNDQYSFDELVQASSLQSFVTDLSEKYGRNPSGRIYVPISDEEATVTYYLVCRQGRKGEFRGLMGVV